MQVFYSQFGELMMRQPVIGLDFQSWMPLAIVPYMLMLVFNVFNRCAHSLSAHACLQYLQQMRSQPGKATSAVVPHILISVFNICAWSFNLVTVDGALCA